MSFTDRIKDELLSIEYEDTEEKRGFLLGAIKAIGVLEIKKSGIAVVFSCYNYGLIMKIAGIIKALYRTELNVSRTGQADDKKGFLYTLSVPSSKAKNVLEDTKTAVLMDGEIIGFKSDFDSEIYKNEKALKAVVRALFISAGNAYVPSKIDLSEEELTNKSEGYRIEFVFEDENLALSVCELLQFLSNKIKVIERQRSYVVYAKDSGLICDIFAWLGANNGVLELNDIIVERTVSNEMNRMNNCSLANIDKTVNAGLKQIKAIEYIQMTVGLDKIADNLKEIALLRIAKPSATLTELEDELGGRITKSGINHRLRKIVELAEELKNKNGDNQ